MNVAAILKHKGDAVVTCSQQTTLNEVTRLLKDHHIGSVVVVDDKDMVAGIVSERDIVTAIAHESAAVLDEPVGGRMTRRVYTCTRADTLERLMAEMTAHRFRHLPVVENGTLIGIVSIGDVVKQRIAEAEMEASVLRDYIKTG